MDFSLVDYTLLRYIFLYFFYLLVFALIFTLAVRFFKSVINMLFPK